jgi:hypothetical protein
MLLRFSTLSFLILICPLQAREGDIEFTTDFFAGTWKVAMLYGPAAVDGTWILNADGTGQLSEKVEKRQLGSGDPRDHPLRNRVGKKYEIETEAQWGISGKFLVIKRFQSDTRGVDKIHHALIPLELTRDQCTFKDKGNPKSRIVLTRVKGPTDPSEQTPQP